MRQGQRRKPLAFDHFQGRLTVKWGAAMALPPGINKATGLVVALSKLGLPRHVVVGIGDAENDHLLLAYCECGVAVENASLHFKQPPPLSRAAKTALRCHSSHGRQVGSHLALMGHTSATT